MAYAKKSCTKETPHVEVYILKADGDWHDYGYFDLRRSVKRGDKVTYTDWEE